MRTEQEVRELYRQYVYRYAISDIDGKRTAANQYFGAAIATGRTLGRDLKRIRKDFTTAKEFIGRLRAEGKPLPGFKNA